MKDKLFGIILLLVASLLLTGCTTKEVISAEEFKLVTEEYGYTVQDDTESYQMQTSFEKVLIATKNDDIYQIEYYEFSDEETAIQIYENQKMIIEGTSEVSSHKSIEAMNYDKYEQTSDINYGVVVRVENTLIHAIVNIEHKKEIQEILEKLNY